MGSSGESLGISQPNQQAGLIEPFDRQETLTLNEQEEAKQIDELLVASQTINIQLATAFLPLAQASTQNEPDLTDENVTNESGVMSNILCPPNDGGKSDGNPDSGPASPPRPETASQSMSNNLSGSGKSLGSRTAAGQTSNDFGTEPFQTPFSKVALPLANNLESVFQVRMSTLKPNESVRDLFYLRSHVLPNPSSAVSGQHKEEPIPIEQTLGALALPVTPAQINPCASELNKVITTNQDFPDLEFRSQNSRERGLLGETAINMEGTLENPAGFGNATSSSSPVDHKSKPPSTLPAEPVVESAPLFKRNVSQLVLRVGENQESTLAVRLNMHGAGLHMEVLGGDVRLRDSLLGALPSLEKTLERQAKEGGWRVPSESSPADPRPLQQASATSREGETNGSQQEESSRRSGEDQPHRRKDRKKEQFTFSGQTGYHP